MGPSTTAQMFTVPNMMREQAPVLMEMSECNLDFSFVQDCFTSCLPLSTPLHVTSSIKRKCYCCSCTELLNSHRFWNADNGDWCWHICMKYIPVVGILCLTATQWLGLNINWLITLKLNSSSESTECADHCFAKIFSVFWLKGSGVAIEDTPYPQL